MESEVNNTILRKKNLYFLKKTTNRLEIEKMNRKTIKKND